MPVFYNKQAEIEVFRHWIDRLQRDYREPLDIQSQNLLTKYNRELLKGDHFGRDTQDSSMPRHKLWLS